MMRWSANIIRRFMLWYRPAKPRRDLHQDAVEIAEKERHLALLKMQREAAQREMLAAFDQLLHFREANHGDR